MKTHFKKLMNPTYLGSWDLLNKNNEYIKISTSITEVIKKEIHNGKDLEEQVVANLKGYKPMILNSTNVKKVVELTKSEFIEDWIGKSINIEVQKVRAFGGMHDALRITKTLPNLDVNHPNWDKMKKAVTEKKVEVTAIKKRYLLTPENEKLLCLK